MWCSRARGLHCLLVVSLLGFGCASSVERHVESVPVAGSSQEALRYAFSFGSSGQMQGQFREPSSISVDPFDALLVADTGNNRIQKFDASGHFVLEFGSLGLGEGGLNGPTDVIENSLAVYVVDARNERVVQYDRQGNYVSVCVSSEDFPGSLRDFVPLHIAFSGTGLAFVSDVESDAIAVFSKFWDLLALVGGFGGGEGRFSDPAGMATTKKGEVIVCDTGNKRLQILNDVGNVVGVLDLSAAGPFREPVDVAADATGTLYVADRGNRQVLVVSRDGEIEAAVREAGGSAFIVPCAVAVSLRGFLYVVDSGSDQVHAFEIGKYAITPDTQ